MKFLIFIGIATAIYFLLIRPIFIGAAKTQTGGLGDMMEAFSKMREQMQNGGSQNDFTTDDGQMKVNKPQNKKNKSSNDDGEFIDYEEIK